MLDATDATVTVATDTFVVSQTTHVSDTCTIQIKRGRLLAGLKSVLPFVCQDDTRFHLCCISVEIVNPKETLRLVASDGHTLARAEVRTGDVDGSHMSQTLLKSADAKTLIKTLACKRSESDQIVTLAVTKRQITVRVGDTSLEFTALDATFPPYTQVIPTYSSKTAAPTVSVNPVYIARACDAIAAFGRGSDSARGASFSFGTSVLDPILVTFETPDLGTFLAVIMPMGK